MLLALFSLMIILFANVYCDSKCDPNMKWMRNLTLDENGQMIIKWNFTDDNITMMMMAQTKGWMLVGFGSRRIGFLDAIVGWISNNKAYLQDRFLDTNSSEPALDKIQSLQLIEGTESENYTSICFTRKLTACDDQDFTITEITTDVFWSFGESDPVDGKIKMVKNEPKTVGLLNIIYSAPSSNTYIIPGRNKTLTSKDGSTVYWCSYYKIPPTVNETYFIRADALIPKRNMMYVHHMVVYSCNNDEIAKVYDKIDPQGYICQSKNNAEFYGHCQTYQAIWAVGAEDQYFPPSTGFPFGKANSTTYYRLDVHYDLVNLQGELTDNSGMMLYITTEKPKYILGIIETQYQTTSLLVIPPRQKNFTVFTVCNPKCLQQSIPNDGITVTGVFYHAHRLGIGMKLHIIRNKKEIQSLIENNFEFQFQGYRLLKKERKILKNDILAIECTYDTSAINYTTVGNIGTSDEMCNVVLLYYPAINLEYCGSFIKPENLLSITDIEEIGNPVGIPKCEGPNCQTPYGKTSNTNPIPILKPSKYANMTLDAFWQKFTNWTSINIEKLQQLYLGKQTPVCSGNSKLYDSKVTDTVQYPADMVTYKNPDTCGR